MRACVCGLIVGISVLAAPAPQPGGLRDDLRAALVAAVETAPDGRLQPETRRAAGLALVRLGDAQHGLEQLHMLSKDNALDRIGVAHASSGLQLAIALAYAQRGDIRPTEGAAGPLTRSDRALCLLTAAQAAHKGGEDAAATEALRKAQELSEDQEHGQWPEVLLMLAETERIMGNPGKAREAVTRASEQIHSERGLPYGARGLAQLGAVYAHLGETDRMHEVFAEALEAAKALPGEPVFAREAALSSVARIAAEAGVLPAAEAASDALRTSNWNNDTCIVALSTAFARKGGLSRALEVAQTAATEWGRGRAVLHVAVERARQGHSAEAIQLAESTQLRYDPYVLRLPDAPQFSWRRPETWVLNYRLDSASGSLTASYNDEQDKADTAAAAMALEQILGAPRGRDYLAAFSAETPPILRSLTRAQSLEGHPQEALRWAQEVRAGDPRVWAVLGVADALTFAPVPSELVEPEPASSGILVFMQ